MLLSLPGDLALAESRDLERGLKEFYDQNCDSMFSCSVAEDLFFWERTADGM